MEAIKSFAPIRQLLGFVQKTFKLCKCTKRVMREPLVVVKLLQKGAENGMFGHPAGNTSGVLDVLAFE